jgi:hypothetical protein
MVSKWVKVCDLDHEEGAETWADETVGFQVDGQVIELDLCNAHHVQWEAFARQQEMWRSHGRVQVPAAAPPAPRRSAGGSDRSAQEHRRENAAIREWAKTQPDIDLGDRGRIADSVRKRYRDAMAAAAGNRWTAAASDDPASENGHGPLVGAGTSNG